MKRRWLRDLTRFLGVFAAATLLTWALSGLNDDNNPFAVPLYVLAVALVARVTDGYVYGIAASLLGTVLVNWLFTYPFGEFDITITGYPLTFAMMLVVSIIISALTTQIKNVQQLRVEAEREKTHADLLRAISHDLRTPLASILGAASALSEQTLSAEDQQTLVREISHEAQWLVRITENLLSVTRFSGDIALSKEEEVVEEIVGSAIVKYRGTKGALPVSVDKPEEILLAPMDATLIRQVLLNLFDNVTLHAEGATAIWVTIRDEGGQVSVSVEDDGCGIPPAALPHIFDGQATVGTHTDARRGMGIGLSVCRSIARAHGGELSAGISGYGGAKFVFTLPAQN